MTAEAYVSHEDLFNAASVRDARGVDDKMRELAPVVKLARENITILGRYAQVAAGLRDWKTFSSTSRPWHDPRSVRPELLLTDDPQKHTRVRAVISGALSPQVLGKMADAFRVEADALVIAMEEKGGATIDAVAEITQAFVYKVLPDLLGIPTAGRVHLYAFGNMVWATMGPMNELYDAAMRDTGPVIEWATSCVEQPLMLSSSGGWLEITRQTTPIVEWPRHAVYS